MQQSLQESRSSKQTRELILLPGIGPLPPFGNPSDKLPEQLWTTASMPRVSQGLEDRLVPEKGKSRE